MLALGFDSELLWMILQAAIGLGFIIFVHELGHFAVAKMCGVKCEKFMIGFDIGGLKLSRKWGETVYGIGILPLGGYVKMLGQDDDPSHIAEQMQKSQVDLDTGEGVEITGPDGKKYVVDRRSYLAKSVPQRMAIISAGVIMNVIFAFVFAVIAFGMGVPYMPCIISHTVAGSPAWQANLRTGDDIVRIADIEQPSFSKLTGKVTLANLEEGVPLVVRRGSGGSEETITLKPRQNNGAGLAKIGIASPSSLRLLEELPTVKGSPAADADFQGGDEIIRVGDTPIKDFRELAAQLLAHPQQRLQVTVRRGGQENPDNPFAPRVGGEEITLTVAPNLMKRCGLVMEMGAISAVQPGSPAAEVGILPGDVILAINGRGLASTPATGQRAWDPLELPERIQQFALRNESTTLLLSRAAEEGGDASRREFEVQVEPRVVDWFESYESPEAPVSVPSWGIAYPIQNKVVEVVPASPAAKADLQAGDRLLAATIVVPKPDGDGTTSLTLELGDELNWPMLISQLQQLPAGTTVQLKYERGDVEQEVTLSPQEDPQESVYIAERGFRLEPLQRIREARTFREQLTLGWEETVNSLLLVYRFLQKLFETQVPVTALGGPITIAKAAGISASQGVSTFLMFLTMLSANLAVVNFLPIPMLDGGHMVFLAYEGVFGRPANERFVMALHLAGFAFIIGLMLFLVALDVGLIPRNL